MDDPTTAPEATPATAPETATPAQQLTLRPAAAEQSPAGRRWLVRLIVVAVLAGGGYVLKATVFAPKPVEVLVAKVERGRVESTVTNSRAGTVKARRRARVSPEAAGRVVELPHREGARVEKGELLLRLDDTSQQARLLVAKRALEAAEALHVEAHARRDRAEQEQKRAKQLATSGIVTADDVERLESMLLVALASCDTSSARVEQAKAEVKLAEAEVDKCLLRAPFPGVLAEVAVELGEWITPSPPVTPVPGVIDLIDTSSIYVSAPMDEVDSAVIRAGQPARVTLDPLPGKSFPGKVTRVAAYVLDLEAQNRTVEIEVELQDAAMASAFLPGTSADVEVILETKDEVLRIPAPAILEGSRVLIFEEGILRELEVQVGIRNWDFAEISSGLQAGQQVVTTLGKQEVQDGAEAVIAKQKAP